MRILIVEDEKYNADLLTGLVNKHFPDMEIIGYAKGVQDGIEAVRNLRPDLLLLDIEIQGGTGFDLLEKTSDIAYKVIFCTGYDQFALRAFKFSAVDYLLKPLSVEDFVAAINKAREITDQEETIKTLLDFNKWQEPRYLMLTARNGFSKISIDEIVRIGAEGSYSEFELRNGNRVLASKPIGYFEEFLPVERFVRVHHSAIINLNYVKEYDVTLGIVYLHNNTEQPVSVRKRKVLSIHFENGK